ncbi:unnamed protein product [Adineta ricciae]|uniref:RING-type domain-containing protein n=1 Tax=Adineta ricciae TaxID=249248 RepID=A0A815PZ90_ADIRI|nr:unnamed protein product [Adineta ricciae]
MERLTTCPICLDKFRLPKVLPCMHTFCLTPCLTNMIEPRARTIRCPECRREHPIPPGGVQAFPSNLTMIGFLDLPPPTTLTEIPDRCFICKEPKQTLIECNDCSKFLCTNCRDSHLRDAIYNINSSVSQLRRSLPKLSEKLASYEQRVHNVKANHDQIRREIVQAIGTLIEELKHREAALLTETEVYMQSQLRTFRLQQETAEVELASVASFCDSVGASISNERLINDKDVANMRAQCDRYSQQIETLQSQMPTDVQKLRLVFDNQVNMSSSIQNYGQLIDTSTGQHHPTFSAASHPQTSAHYVTTSRNSAVSRGRSVNDQHRHMDGSQTISYSSTQNSLSNSNNNLPIPARRRSSSSNTTSREQQSSVSGFNPFASNNARSTQRSSVTAPEPSPRRSFVTSTTAARSLEGDDRPIFGGSGSGSGNVAHNFVGRGRSRFPPMGPIQEQTTLSNSLERHDTFVLEEPSLPSLPQSGAQRPRDTVIVEELYNVRRRRRAKTPVAFTVDLNGTRQPSAT